MKKNYKVLQLVKYYNPCQGGMETVVKNIVEGVLHCNNTFNFSVYSNNHKICFKRLFIFNQRETIIKEITPFTLKSQPLNLRYPFLKTLIKESDIIHHHYPYPTMELTLFRYLKYLKNKKLIITWHANIKNSRWSWLEKIYNPVVEKLLNRADCIIVTTPQLFEASNILKKYEHKVKVIPLSFDPKYSIIESKSYPENRCFNLLFVGKLRKYKGVEYLIKAIIDLDVKLIIVGNGEELINLKTLVTLLNVSHKVEFNVNIDDEKLTFLYKKADLFVLPSINEAEAFGVVQLEAMSNGLPVINTNLNSGVPFVSLNNYSGFTVDPKNVEDLKNAIQKVITNKELYIQFSKNALERSKLFSRDKMANDYIKIYKS
jgi:glycosyltransferase involved in cell wall biosynthesis